MSSLGHAGAAGTIYVPVIEDGVWVLRRVVIAVIACLALAGCSAGGISPEPTPTPVVVTPDTGGPLTGRGYHNYPAGLVWLPDGVSLTYTADQPNVLIAMGPIGEARAVQDYLTATLPGLGWRITATADDALMFTQGQWRGAFVRGVDSWALTVRDD